MNLQNWVPSLSDTKRFWRFVKKTDGCWLWTASKNWDGYGSFSFQIQRGEKRTITAHRVSWVIHGNKLVNGFEICHRCDVPNCVNPDHLFLGTHTDNVRDCLYKGRFPCRYGDYSGKRKTNADDVRRMREEYSTGGVRQVDLAVKYGLDQTTVSNILIRKTWKHVS